MLGCVVVVCADTSLAEAQEGRALANPRGPGGASMHARAGYRPEAHVLESLEEEPELAALEPDTHRLSVRGRDRRPPVHLFVIEDEAHRWVCETPCELVVHAGPVVLALATSRTATPLPVDDVLDIEGPGTLSVTLSDFEPRRPLGVILMVLGGCAWLVGGGLVIGLLNADDLGRTVAAAFLGPAFGAIGLAFTIAGAVFLARPSRSHAVFEPAP